MYNEEYLRNNGVDMDKALELLEDMEMYNETIHDFYDKLDDVFTKLENYKDSGNVEDYVIEVHALKSDCKYLGFTPLANLAYNHELKGKENDLDFINDNFASLVEEKNKLVEIIKPYVENN